LGPEGAHAAAALVVVFADGPGGIRVIRFGDTISAVFAVADWLGCAAVHVHQAFHARLRADVTNGFACVFAVQIGRTSAVALRIRAAKRSCRTMAVDEAFFAFAVLLIASRLSGSAVAVRDAFGTLKTRRIAQRSARILAVGAGQTTNANARHDFADGFIARTIAVGFACRFALEVPRITRLSRSTIGRSSALFATSQHAEW